MSTVGKCDTRLKLQSFRHLHLKLNYHSSLEILLRTIFFATLDLMIDWFYYIYKPVTKIITPYSKELKKSRLSSVMHYCCVTHQWKPTNIFSQWSWYILLILQVAKYFTDYFCPDSLKNYCDLNSYVKSGDGDQDAWQQLIILYSLYLSSYFIRILWNLHRSEPLIDYYYIPQ